MKKKIIITLLVIIFVILIGVGIYSKNKSPISYYVVLDINPSVEFILDEEYNVKEMIALNEEAEIVLYKTRFNNYSLEESLITYLQQTINVGYIDKDDNNKIEIIVYASEQEIEENLKKEIAEKIKTFLEGEKISNEIVFKTISKDFSNLLNKKETNYSKILLIEKICELDKNLDKNKLKNYSIEKLQKTLIEIAEKKAQNKKMNAEQFDKYLDEEKKLLINKTKNKGLEKHGEDSENIEQDNKIDKFYQERIDIRNRIRPNRRIEKRESQ